MLSFTLSEARDRVREQLANLSPPNDAAGVTSEVSGGVSFDESGSVVPDSHITVDLSTLQSDQYPNATFVPTELRGLTFPLPTSGSAGFEILGDPTIRDVTRPVVWQAEAEFDSAAVSVTAATRFIFDDFELTRHHLPARRAAVAPYAHRVGRGLHGQFRHRALHQLIGGRRGLQGRADLVKHVSPSCFRPPRKLK